MTKASIRLTIASRLNNEAARGIEMLDQHGSAQLRSDDGEDRQQEGRGERFLIAVEAQARLGGLDHDDGAGDERELDDQPERGAGGADGGAGDRTVPRAAAARCRRSCRG